MLTIGRRYDAAAMNVATPAMPALVVPQPRPADTALRVLLLEDSWADAALTQEHLLATRPGVVFDHVERLADITPVRAQAADCALLDLSVPDASGLQVVAGVRALAPSLPIVVLTGYDDSSLGVAALRTGAQDYVVKNRADGFTLDRAIRYACERLQLERQLSYQALHDTLTGLPNRALFQDRAVHAIARAQRTGGLLAVMLADLDGFKAVNDSLGHAAGDTLLVELAHRLAGVMRTGDTLARLGGDEFGVLCEGLTSREEVARIAARLAETVATPFVVDGRANHVGISIGMTTALAGHTDPDVLLRDADIALYEAKNRGRGQACWFTAALHDRAVDRRGLETSLREAVRGGTGLSVAFQPVVDLRTATPVMVAAVARWRDPRRGEIAPDVLAGIAEQSNLVVELDRAVLARALDELVARRHSHADLRVSVHVSGRTLASVGYVEQVSRLLAGAGLAGDALTLEIVEAALRNPTALDAAAQLRRAGVQLALENFGPARRAWRSCLRCASVRSSSARASSPPARRGTGPPSPYCGPSPRCARSSAWTSSPTA